MPCISRDSGSVLSVYSGTQAGRTKGLLPPGLAEAAALLARDERRRPAREEGEGAVGEGGLGRTPNLRTLETHKNTP